MKKRVIIFSIIFLLVLFSNKISTKAVVSDGFIIGNEVYENLNQDKAISNGWGYDSSTNTLILSNYNGGKIQVFIEELNIKLIGNNYISDIGKGIEASNKLIFDGTNGSLNISMSSENSIAISGKDITLNSGEYIFTALTVGVFANDNININNANLKIISSGMGLQVSRDIVINDSIVNIRTNNTSIYSVSGKIKVSNSKVISISKSIALYGKTIEIVNNSVLALEGTSRAINANNLNIPNNLPIKGGNTKEEVTDIDDITNQKYVYINRNPNTNLPLNLRIEKSGSKLILTWNNNLNFYVLFQNQIYEVSSSVNSYELEITNVKDSYQVEVYSIDEDGIESYHLVKTINNDDNPDTKDNLLENVFYVIIGTCVLIYFVVKLIKDKKSS